MRRYKNLKVWQKPMDLTESVFQMSLNFPSKERFGLSSQIRRSAVSVQANIANGSLNELETQILIGHQLKYLATTKLDLLLPLIAEVQKMNYALSQKLSQEKNNNTSRP